ncbi:MAG: 4-(cytidine 5'-diphospho)-2-C-methyl-D-erythritol kinase [Elusimicrobia bacterium]|nr:4-(cytidine 5'-diphospho)-2-C-methyl-D-erythritol kinase [Elusimicrobiota bacterium]
MPLQVQVPCPAKVNLFLEVTGKRSDGYHTLATLFAKVGLFDVLDAERRDEPGFSLEIVDEAGQGLGAGPDNLVLRAAEAFAAEFGLGGGARLRLTKRIPMGAGLGGGSSDAAGALWALARLHRLELDRSAWARVKRLAPRLGADVPFFLRREAFCDGRGIGDKLKAVHTAKALPWMVLVWPGVHCPTPEAYKRLQRPPRSVVLTRLAQLAKLEKRLAQGRPLEEWEGLLFNRLEDAVLGHRPEVRQAKEILAKTGLRGVLMSGSGASVFGFAASRAEAEGAARRLAGYPWKVYLTCCLG